MKTDYGLERFDPADPADLARYERAFYTAFRRAAGNQLIRSLWSWDDARERVAVQVPYEDQRIYVLRTPSGEVGTGLAINVALNTFQAAAYGFAPPDPPEGCCEFLTFFTAERHPMSTFFRLWADTFEDLREAGFHTGYGTTAPRVMGFYRWMGAEVLETREIGGEVRHFFRLPLAPAAQRPRQARAEQIGWVGGRSYDHMGRANEPFDTGSRIDRLCEPLDL